MYDTMLGYFGALGEAKRDSNEGHPINLNQYADETLELLIE